MSDLMLPGEVAALFRVDPKTVTRWAKAGRVRSTTTPGGYCRIYREDVEKPLAGELPVHVNGVATTVAETP